MATAKLCAVHDCDKPIIAHGYCTKHYQRWKKHGDPMQTHRNEGAECSVDQCGKLVKAKGLCRAHYWRMQKHGDPLAGRTPEGAPERFLNDVVLAYEGDECLTWPYSDNGVGYGLLWRDGKQQLVSRIICEARHGAPPTQEHEAAHTCGHGHLRCVTPRHIQWETPSENQMYRVQHDTHHRGERHPLVKITEAEVRQIRTLEGKMLQREVAEMFGIGRIQVGRIWRRERWGWLE